MVVSPARDRVARLETCALTLERPDGSDRRTLDYLGCPYAIAGWSPDGRKLLVMYDVSGLHFTMDAVPVGSPDEDVRIATGVRVNHPRSWPGNGDVSWQPVVEADVAAAAPAKRRQRIVITNGRASTFVLAPGKGGVLSRDSGEVWWRQESARPVLQDGRRVERWVGTATFVGTRGRLVLRVRADWLEGRNGEERGVGTWTVVRGSGAYAGVTGAGTTTHRWSGWMRNSTSWRMEGFLRKT